MIEIYDAVERKTVATGTSIVPLPGANNVGVRNCHNQPGQELQTQYSYVLVNTDTGGRVSAECTALPGRGMQIGSFHLN